MNKPTYPWRGNGTTGRDGMLRSTVTRLGRHSSRDKVLSHNSRGNSLRPSHKSISTAPTPLTFKTSRVLFRTELCDWTGSRIWLATPSTTLTFSPGNGSCRLSVLSRLFLVGGLSPLARPLRPTRPVKTVSLRSPFSSYHSLLEVEPLKSTISSPVSYNRTLDSFPKKGEFLNTSGVSSVGNTSSTHPRSLSLGPKVNIDEWIKKRFSKECLGSRYRWSSCLLTGGNLHADYLRDLGLF